MRVNRPSRRRLETGKQYFSPRPSYASTAAAKPLAVLTTAGLLSIITNVFASYCLGRAIDTLSRGPQSTSRSWALVSLVSFGVSGVCWLGQGWNTASIVARTLWWTRRSVYRAAVSVDAKSPDQSHRNSSSLVVNDADNVGVSLQQTLSQSINSGLLAVGLAAAIFAISPWVGTLIIGILPILILSSRLVARKAAEAANRQYKGIESLASTSYQMCLLQPEIRSGLGNQVVTVDQEALTNTICRTARSTLWFSSIPPVIVQFASGTASLLAVGLGLFLARRGEMSVGDVVVVGQYARQLAGPLTQAANVYGFVQSGLSSWRRLRDFTTRRAEPAVRPPTTAAVEGVAVSTDALTYFGNQSAAIVSNVTLDILLGSTTYLVGPSGAGKSTLAALLADELAPSTGSLAVTTASHWVDGGGSRPRNVQWVRQAPLLVGGTIRSTVLLGRPADMYRSAVQAVLLSHTIETLAGSSREYPGPAVELFSPSQNRQLALARALIDEPSMLILDETTSLLDPLSEVEIRTNIRRMYPHITLLIITHRTETIDGNFPVIRVRDGLVKQ